MNLIISLLYAPIVFTSLRYFDITKVSLAIFCLSILWFLLVFKRGYKEFAYPLLYLCISILAFFLKEFLILKTLPLLISSFITALIFISYLNKTSIILFFAKKFSKKGIFTKRGRVYSQINSFLVFYFFN